VKVLENELLETINNGNASLIGPNCMGLFPYYSGSFGGPFLN